MKRSCSPCLGEPSSKRQRTDGGEAQQREEGGEARLRAENEALRREKDEEKSKVQQLRSKIEELQTKIGELETELEPVRAAQKAEKTKRLGREARLRRFSWLPPIDPNEECK